MSYDLLRANGLKNYGNRVLKLGEEFIVDAKFTHGLLALGLATLVRRDVEPPDPPALLRDPRKTRKTVRGKRTYKTRHLTAQ